MLNTKKISFLGRSFSHLSKFASVDPDALSGAKQTFLLNKVDGVWKQSKDYLKILDPLNGELFLDVPDTQRDSELKEFSDSMMKCPKYGLHNPLYNVHRYTKYGDVCFRVAAALREKEVEDFFTKCIQRVLPKSDIQARGEVIVSRKFFENFTSDNIRFLLRGSHVAGDHDGQQSNGYRWPYGRTAVIAPFNFPFEIPALQVMAALFSGNKVLLKADSRVSLVAEQMVRLFEYCGMPPTDLDLLHCDGPAMEKLIKSTDFRLIQFTGSAKVANHLSVVTKGKVKIEDAGFDWKILGPDVNEIDYVSWMCDQDAYAASGQKCSAQSFLACHENWMKVGIIDKIKALAERRSLKDKTLCPILTWNDDQINTVQNQILKIPGSKILFGGKPLERGSIPSVYGAWQPTAIYVPLIEILKKENFSTVTKEVFGPFQIVTSYKSEEVELILDAIERMDHHLTAGIVSNDMIFVNKILGRSVNGVTYTGMRARTTGAPQNHWFGPAGDPRGTGIGSPEAILGAWTCHREIIQDIGPIPHGWKLPSAT